ncbi:DNA polymerase ligase-domain-containing protein [Lophiotrema nucula]|uniref:DNA polymerase ligase-domain-containing protein n=1 Tax=Lophiotrema nucula TaxID=690887 RepID=A0A6A5YQG8_9PLEO|nr:DNA polymerase ligase-domain-containing protein [Lophiotrema nucula]
MDTPNSLVRDISPPAKRRRASKDTVSSRPEDDSKTSQASRIEPTLAAIEAGRAKIENHLAYFSEYLSKASRKTEEGFTRLPIKKFRKLYKTNSHEQGSHFVIHQHNHPIAGVHYDLRLQFSNSSSVSWSVPKGLPGNPNSKTLGRMAVETRVHNFWNHLIESASPNSGSLLIWDTGTYSVLPRKVAKDGPPSPQTTDDDDTDGEDMRAPAYNTDKRPENEKLIQAFQTRYIRLCLHGTRLPPNYTVTLRLPSANDVSKYNPDDPRPTSRRKRSATKGGPKAKEDFVDTHSDDDEDLQTRRNNAYPGSTNSIGSIHQRQWFMSLDMRSCGFVQGSTGKWGHDGKGGGFETFFVRGRDVERSVVTGRLAREVEEDEGVEDFVGRQGWVAIEL